MCIIDEINEVKWWRPFLGADICIVQKPITFSAAESLNMRVVDI